MAYEQLEKDVIQLQESMNILQELVQEQQAPIDNLEDFIHHSKQDIKKANTELVESKSYSYSSYFIYAYNLQILLFILSKMNVIIQ